MFVVLSRAGFSLPALFVTLPATPEAPPGRNENVIWILWKEKFRDPRSSAKRAHSLAL